MQKKLVLAALVVLCASIFASAQMPSPPPAKTPGDAVNSILNIVEMEFTGAAKAMPEDKYSFAPTSGEFKGVRTFAQQVKHVAAANYLFASSVLGEKPPVDTGGENGPDALKTKADILKFLDDSFVYLHKALASVTEKNELDTIDTPFGMKPSRLGFASFAPTHVMDHYGQMVVYLRMNGVVPPASQQQQGR